MPVCFLKKFNFQYVVFAQKLTRYDIFNSNQVFLKLYFRLLITAWFKKKMLRVQKHASCIAFFSKMKKENFPSNSDRAGSCFVFHSCWTWRKNGLASCWRVASRWSSLIYEVNKAASTQREHLFVVNKGEKRKEIMKRRWKVYTLTLTHCIFYILTAQST